MNLFKAIARAFKRPRGPAELARWLDVPEADLRAWLGSAAPWTRGYDYRSFEIPKRRGGTRRIDAPSEKLKDLQRRILRRLLNPLRFHEAATGFVRERSIVDNADAHVGQAVVINLDLADFFPSITAERVQAAFRGLGWDEQAALILARICTLDGRLPQGAPTSPAISNLVCRRLDERLSGLARRYDGAYTRYADDITLSFPAFGRNRRLRPRPRNRPAPARSGSPAARPAPRSLITWARNILEAEGFRIQMKKKLRVLRPHQRQTVTGLVVNQQVNLPRATRRLIRAMQHRQRLGRLDEAGQRRLQGLEALLHMVETQR